MLPFALQVGIALEDEHHSAEEFVHESLLLHATSLVVLRKRCPQVTQSTQQHQQLKNQEKSGYRQQNCVLGQKEGGSPQIYSSEEQEQFFYNVLKSTENSAWCKRYPVGGI